MSELNYLEKLLDGVEVEWLTAAEIFNIKNGYTPSKAKKEFWEDGNIPWFRLEDIRTNGRELNDSIMHVNQAGVKGNLFPKDSIFMSTTATIGEFALVKIPHLTNQQITNFSLTSRFKGIIDIRYLFHRFHHFGEWCKENANKSGGLSIIGIKKLSSYKFPIPCPDNPEKSLAIQAEIVRILDKFTALTAELTAELNMRKKQYNYYRDQLLSFEEGEVEWKTLDEVASFRRGSFPQPYGNSEWYNGEGCMPFVQVADVADFGFRLHRSTKQQISKLAQSKSVFVEAGTVIVSLQGTIGRVALTQYDCYVDRTLAIFTKYKAAVNKKYFAHQLKAKFDLEKEFARGSTLKTITKEEFSKFQIPIPPLEVQNRIVALLDKFDRLTHSIEEGLPRELELRQKQYEYYRELLFSFPRPETASN
ncbi:restriction endonuclease subunit S [Salmonella enterica subsp. enterica serovar Livingstone]|uniref:restriction endonuclease subunit S n=1 Tax=Enterobacter cloacae complex TaxID=354276 RepID=UPI0003BE5BD3|nr:MULTISPECIES: restriction endonuclease subunit S [Enterobacter cloacae complex]EAA2608335.1 restriction endonuclease subunit S [Salmonella enterica subsp. enterica serovar Senftenberg]EDX8739961.1 restriction endonuclease subunit S [Salmonella enterica subsp. enterica serovar Galiema]EED7479728.1 restriction endonuclease subunit S [Salmonella enterica subsp. enterica serovar Livingstone]EBS1237645.1 restriction endonuclease subunit S [Salmonella enterica subsp. enterica serovar Senftenberg]